MSDAIEDVPIRGDMIRLGQLLKLVDAVESGAEAGAVITAGDVTVDGEVETRRGRQLHEGSVVVVHAPAGSRSWRVTADG